MSRAWQIDKQSRREEDRLLEDYNNGDISREDYNAEMREIARAEREAYEQDRDDALREVDAEWGW